MHPAAVFVLLLGLLAGWSSQAQAEQEAPEVILPPEIFPAASAPASLPESTPSSVPSSPPESAPAEAASAPTLPKIPAHLLPFVPVLDASIDPSTGSLGGLFLYTVSVERSREVEVFLPEEIPFPPELELKQPMQKQTEDLGEGMVRELYSYELQAFGVGTLTIPGLPVAFRAPAGEASVALPAVSLEIPETVKPGEDIKDQFAPREIAPPEETWQELLERYGPYALGGLLLLVFLLWLLFRRRAQKEEPKEERRSPREEAMLALETLEREKPPALEFHERLSGILRGYLEDGLGIPAREATSSELLARVRRASIEGIDLVTLEALLLESDLAKFAREKPPLPDLLRALEVVRSLVEATARASGSREEVAP